MKSAFRTITFFVFAFVVLLSGFCQADVKLPSVFSEHMVLQRKFPIPVWGWAEKDEEVTVTLGERKATATADENGKWKVRLAAMEAVGPHELKVTGKNEVVIKNVLMGEVWVCSGQSNMEWPLTRALFPQIEIPAADYQQIRMYNVPHVISQEPKDDIDGAAWTVCTPDSAKGFSAVAYFFGRHLHKTLNVPVGLIGTNWGGTRAEAWTSREGLETDEDFKPILERAKDFKPKNPHQASVLYNGMLAPLMPYRIRGAIWYQGESNVSRAQQYAKLFPAMISDWRKNWGQDDFPFLFVQLAPYRYGKTDPIACAELWEAQNTTLKLENTGMAVINDIGDTRDIHPRNKQEVGYRLALWALANTYNQKELVFSGPLLKAQCIEDGYIRVFFRHVGGGLKTRNGQPPSHFQICGDDEEFVDAEAKIEGDTVVVSSPDVPEPIAVRFAWRDDAEPNLANKDGLPASAFRTDNFKMVTDGAK